MLQTNILVTAVTISLVAGLALVGDAFRRMIQGTHKSDRVITF